ncbi:MAG: acyl-CoA desaturase [Candidatus Sumerlaeaceae bacterium]|nr:acyl-CoA desaturase [Candidatus Sumerlaeaceae bacterium]
MQQNSLAQAKNESVQTAQIVEGPYKSAERTGVPGGLAFWGVHLACLFVFAVGFSWVALAVAMLTYWLRVFALTAGYHRYFAHRSYKTSRLFQFLMAFLGASSAQMGPLWWAAHHRHHHRFSDTEEDIHSPVISGFWWSHMGWVLSDRYNKTNYNKIPDFAKFPELRFINRFHVIAPIALAVGLYYLGAWLQVAAPSLGTSGWQLVIWGFFISTTLVYHATFFVNSLAHVVGSRRFLTRDQSRNNWFIALVTMGEGWHNNHHRYPSSAQQGFYWWEIDMSHYVLRMLSWVGLVWDLRKPPEELYDEAAGQKRIEQDIAA